MDQPKEIDEKVNKILEDLDKLVKLNTKDAVESLAQDIEKAINDAKKQITSTLNSKNKK